MGDLKSEMLSLEAQAKIQFEQLPLEIINFILKYVDAPSLYQLSKTNQHLEQIIKSNSLFMKKIIAHKKQEKAAKWERLRMMVFGE